MATWPATLPTFQEFLEGSYREFLANNVIRTEMDIGPAKIRRRGTAAPDIISGTMHMTSTQVGIFQTFYEDTIYYGSTTIDTIHPRTTAAITVNLLEQPQISRHGADWQVTLTCEILP